MTAPPLDETPEIETPDVQGIAETEIQSVDAPDVETDETIDGAPTDSEGPEASDASEPAQAAAPEPEPVVEPEPFAVTVRDQAYQLPGVKFDPQNRTLKFEDERAVHRLRQIVKAGREFESQGRHDLARMQHVIEHIKQEKSAEQEAAAEYLAQWQHMMDPRLSDEDVFAFIQQARGQWPQIELQAKTKHLERELERAREAPRNDVPEVDVESIVEEAQAGTAQFVQHTLANESWATADVQRELIGLLQDEGMLSQFVFRARQDIPEQNVRRGQWVADWDRAQALLQKLATPYQRAAQKSAASATQAAQRVKQTQTAATTNAKVLATARPAVAAAKAATTSTAAPARPMTRTEHQAHLAKVMENAWAEARRTR